MPLKVVDPPVVARVWSLEGTVVRTCPAVAERERLEKAVRVPRTNKPSALLEERLRGPAVALMSPRRARVGLVVREKPLLLVLVRVPPRIKLVAISPLVVLASRLVAATPVSIRACFWASLRKPAKETLALAVGAKEMLPAVVMTPWSTKVLAVRVAVPVLLRLSWEPLAALSLPVAVLALRAKVPLPAVLIEPVALISRSVKALRPKLPAVEAMAPLIVRLPLLVVMVELPAVARPG